MGPAAVRSPSVSLRADPRSTLVAFEAPSDLWRADTTRRRASAPAPTVDVPFRWASGALRPHLAGAIDDRPAAKEPLQSLGEHTWLVVLKPAGMAVLRGRRSLANALLALQHARGMTRLKQEGEKAAQQEEVVEEEQGPWTVGFDGPARVGGCWLCCKTAEASVALLDGSARPQLVWRAIFRGGMGDAEAAGLPNRPVGWVVPCAMAASSRLVFVAHRNWTWSGGARQWRRRGTRWWVTGPIVTGHRCACGWRQWTWSVSPKD